MVIPKQLLLLQGATFCHLIFMQNLTEGLPPTERAQEEGRLQCAADFAIRIFYTSVHNSKISVSCFKVRKWPF